jgi:Sigma-70, region 4
LWLTWNRAIDELRRDRWRLASESTLPEQRFHALPAPLALTDAAERQTVWDATDTLPAEQRDALVLAFFQRLSHQEIATCLRTLLGTIKARIRRALQTLRQQLQGEPGPWERWRHPTLSATRWAVWADITLAGRLTGHEQDARRVVEEIQGRLERVRQAVVILPQEKRVTVFYEVYNAPVMTVGHSTILDQLLR